jgi:uncharacterized protein with von Willebrand factor type A (vWA) domain
VQAPKPEAGQDAASARGSCVRVVTDGWDTRDLKEADALLEELAVSRNKPLAFGLW